MSHAGFVSGTMPVEKPPHPPSHPDLPAVRPEDLTDEEAPKPPSEKMKLATLDIWTMRSKETPQR